MTKPLLLLDIDGVLAPFGGDYADTHMGVEVGGVYGGFVYLRHDLPEMVQRLMRRYTLMWGTAWEHRANDHLLKHIGLEDPLEYIEFWGSIPGIVEQHMSGAVFLSNTETWKLPWIKSFLDNDERPAVWVDDEAKMDAMVYAERRTLEGKPTLFICTDPAIGFIDSHLDELEKWADDRGEEAVA